MFPGALTVDNAAHSKNRFREYTVLLPASLNPMLNAQKCQLLSVQILNSSTKLHWMTTASAS